MQTRNSDATIFLYVIQ